MDAERIAVRMIAEDALRELGRPVTRETVEDFLCGMVLRLRDDKEELQRALDEERRGGYHRNKGSQPPVAGSQRRDIE